MRLSFIMNTVINFILGWFSYSIAIKYSGIPIWWYLFVVIINIVLSYQHSKVIIVVTGLFDNKEESKCKEDDK